jgi:hypothetical protein
MTTIFARNDRWTAIWLRLLIFRKRAELEDLTHRINQRSQGD